MWKKLLWLIITCSVFFSAFSSGYAFVGLKDGSNDPDVNVKRGDQIRYDQEQAEKRILGDIDFVNKYLWIALWFICFGFVVYNGFKLVTARGNQDTFKKAIKGLLGAGIGIVICFISYGVVRVIINLL